MMKIFVLAILVIALAGCKPVHDDITFHCVGSDKVYKNRGYMMDIKHNHNDCIKLDNK